MQTNGRLFRGDLIANRQAQLALNLSPMRRSDLLPELNSRRDIDHECDFPKGPWTPEMYYDMWDKEPVAARVVEGLPEEAHGVAFSIAESDDETVDTTFEGRFRDLGVNLNGKSWYSDEECNPIVEHLEQWQIMSRICRYGCMLIGTDDGLPLDQPAGGVEEKGSQELKLNDDGKYEPVAGATGGGEYRLAVNAKERQLLYLREFPEVLARITSWEYNRNSPRYGMPLYYYLTFNDLRSGGTGQPTQQARVHWTRILHHPGDGKESNPWIGHSAMRQVRNNLINLRKLHAGPESVWKNGLGLIHFGTNPNMPFQEVDSDELMDMLENAWNSLQPGIATRNLTAQQISLPVNDPTANFLLQAKLIAARTKYPLRVLFGSELGGISQNSQDDERWQRIVRRYRLRSTTPKAVVPLVDRFVMLGLLPEPKSYSIRWPVDSSLTESERADVLVKRTTAWTQYASGGMSAVVPPLSFATEFDSMDKQKAEAMLDSAAEPEPDYTDLLATEGGTGSDAQGAEYAAG